MKAKIFLLNLLILIALVALLYVIEATPYKRLKKWNKQAVVKHNMYTLKASVQKFISYNNGKIPTTVKSAAMYLPDSMVNPYTGKLLTPNDIQIVRYKVPGNSKDVKLNSVNARLRGAPGTLAYGYFIPLGDSLATEYAITGFGADSMPIFDINETTLKKQSIILLHN